MAGTHAMSWTRRASYLHNGMNPVLVNNELMLGGFSLDEFYARVSGTSVTSLLPDALGSTRMLTDGNGNPTASYGYTPYGEASRSGTDDTQFQFTGRENDGASGLYYYRARYYDPSLGRFIQSDPIGLAGGNNTYAYAEGDPLSFYDPLGLWAIGDPFPKGMVDASAGFGDTLSFNLTNRIRSGMGTNGVVNKCSGAYRGGELAVVGLGLAMGGAGLARGGLRFELGNWKQQGKWFFKEGTRGPHVHWGSGGGLQTHHLPWQFQNWAANLGRLVQRGAARSDIENIATVGTGAAVATSGAIGATSGCGCE